MVVFPTASHSADECASMMGCELVEVEGDPFHFCAQSPLLLDPTTFEYYATGLDEARSCAMYQHSDHSEWMDDCCPAHEMLCSP